MTLGNLIKLAGRSHNSTQEGRQSLIYRLCLWNDFPVYSSSGRHFFVVLAFRMAQKQLFYLIKRVCMVSYRLAWHVIALHQFSNVVKGWTTSFMLVWSHFPHHKPKACKHFYTFWWFSSCDLKSVPLLACRRWEFNVCGSIGQHLWCFLFLMTSLLQILSGCEMESQVGSDTFPRNPCIFLSLQQQQDLTNFHFATVAWTAPVV